MKVLGLVNKDSGPGFHRILMPLLLADGIDTKITNSCKEEDLKGCDAIYYNRVISEELLSYRDKYGFKIIVDIDDYWKLDRHHISYDHYRRNDFEQLQIKHLREADLITTTHERLAEEIYPYNRNVIITPNAIPDHEYFKIEKTESEKVRLFWQGSITHEKDIELLRNPFKRLDRNRFFNVLSGYSKHEAWDRMVSSYTNGLSLPGVVLPGKSPFEYYKHYSVADIALIPLVKSRFNSFKSNLKVLEAAHAGIPAIVSHVDPYLDLPVQYVKNQSDWNKWINQLGKDFFFRDEMALRLQFHCKEHFNFNKINSYRMEEIKKVVNNQTKAA